MSAVTHCDVLLCTIIMLQLPTSRYKMSDIANVFKKFYAQLLSTLPMNDDKFITMLYVRDVITFELKTQIDSQQTSTEKAIVFLRDIMSEQTVADGADTHYYELLNLMENSGSTLKELAQEMKTSLMESG